MTGDHEMPADLKCAIFEVAAASAPFVISLIAALFLMSR
jgi:hypothetical protein